MAARAFWKIVRPGNCGMAALGVASGLLLGRPAAVLHADPSWLAPLAAACVTGFGNVLNDLQDIAIDRHAHPERPLPNGSITPAAAGRWAGALLLLGLAFAWISGGLWLVLFAAAVGAALALYETAAKQAGLLGNLLVAALVASTLPFGAVAVGANEVGWGLVLVLTVMAFFSNLAREILKDVEDAAADGRARRTFVHRAGRRTAGVMAATATLAGLLASGPLLSGMLYVARFGPFGPSGLVPARVALVLGIGILAAADCAMVAGAAWAWGRAGRAQRALKLGMLLALAACVVFGAAIAAWLPNWPMSLAGV